MTTSNSATVMELNVMPMTRRLPTVKVDSTRSTMLRRNKNEKAGSYRTWESEKYYTELYGVLVLHNDLYDFLVEYILRIGIICAF